MQSLSSLWHPFLRKSVSNKLPTLYKSGLIVGLFDSQEMAPLYKRCLFQTVVALGSFPPLQHALQALLAFGTHTSNVGSGSLLGASLRSYIQQVRPASLSTMSPTKSIVSAEFCIYPGNNIIDLY